MHDHAELSGVDLAKVTLRSFKEHAGRARHTVERPTVQAPRRRGRPGPPIDLAVALSDGFDLLQAKGGSPAQLARTAWEQAVGQDIARHVKVIRFDAGSGTLTVEASSGAWATSVRLNAVTVLRDLAAHTPPSRIRQLQVVARKQAQHLARGHRLALEAALSTAQSALDAAMTDPEPDHNQERAVAYARAMRRARAELAERQQEES
ncbi:putative nucleic acid-binding Zn ribbon protein [Streptacidiphilus sp. MAP12-33]|uniref:DciA family protein n=1 Tax=Streptacidiphilus sp. MAP12-33 TaxID=3156266 RepID=UPI0035186650